MLSLALLLLAPSMAAASSLLARSLPRFRHNLLNVNNVPRSYANVLAPEAGLGVEVLGGGSTFLQTPHAARLDPTDLDDLIARRYREMGVQAVRPLDEAKAGFDIQCMFPVADLTDIPDPAEDASWRWKASDDAFLAVINNSFAPMLRLPGTRWVSARLAGYYRINTTFPGGALDAAEPDYVVGKRAWPQAYGCAPWPALSPVLMKVGVALVTKIVARYNDVDRWRKLVPTLRGPPLEAASYAPLAPGGERPLAGVALFNEINTLVCGPPRFACSTPDCADPDVWASSCGGAPYSWGTGRYWDGTPQQAWQLAADASKAVKAVSRHILVLGPENAWPPNVPAAHLEGWNRGYLETFANTEGAALDVWTFHMYTSATRPEEPLSIAALLRRNRALLAAFPRFADLPMAVTEFNARFGLPGAAFMNTAQGSIVNSLSLIAMARDPNVTAAFFYLGTEGPFLPKDPLAFPVACRPAFASTGNTTNRQQHHCTDHISCFNFSGGYQHDDCTTFPGVNGFGAQGLGIVATNGALKPHAVAMAEFFAPLAGKRLLPDTGRPVLVTAQTEVLTAIHDDAGCDLTNGTTALHVVAVAFNFSDVAANPDIPGSGSFSAARGPCVGCESAPQPLTAYMPWLSSRQVAGAVLVAHKTLQQRVFGATEDLLYPITDPGIFQSLLHLEGVTRVTAGLNAQEYLEGAYLGEENLLSFALLRVPGCIDIPSSLLSGVESGQ